MAVRPGPIVDRPLRADARRNHEQLLAAAREVVLERGPGAPLEEVARRAGVGIGTLYRRFPDRQALLRAVAVDALADSCRAAQDALDQDSDGLAALAQYLHAALAARVSAVLPLVLDRLDGEDDDLREAREASAALVQRLVDTAHADGTLDPQVGFADIGTLLVRLARPLPGPVPATVDAELARRQLAVFVAGLRAVNEGGTALPGPRLERSDLPGMGSRG